jgi:PPK2 family polyphosphate:nucleotide phosphotransferase
MNFTLRYRLPPGRPVSFRRHRTAETGGISGKAQGRRLLEHGVERLAALQEKLYAQNTWALLVIFQAMDAAGKDSTIKHVLSGVNPQGCQVFSFKAPSPEELDHDYLWRSVRALPERGRIGIHNRSYYEEVLVARVHPAILSRQQLPAKARAGIWKRRFREINEFERYLTDNGTRIVKFFLHVSKEEQRKRFLARLDQPEKGWKFSPADVQQRAFWDDYMAAYEHALTETSTKWAPWHVVPADNKWFMRLVVAEIICDALEDLKVEFPMVPAETRAEWKAAREALLKEEGVRS